MATKTLPSYAHSYSLLFLGFGAFSFYVPSMSYWCFAGLLACTGLSFKCRVSNRDVGVLVSSSACTTSVCAYMSFRGFYYDLQRKRLQLIPTAQPLEPTPQAPEASLPNKPSPVWALCRARRFVAIREVDSEQPVRLQVYKKMTDPKLADDGP